VTTEIGKLKATGPREDDLHITRFYGGSHVGICVQLTATMEDGRIGYVQLSAADCVALVPLLKEHIITPALELERKKAADMMAIIEEKEDILRKSYGMTIRIIDSIVDNDLAHAMVLGGTKFEKGEM